MKRVVRKFDDVLPKTISVLARGGIAASQGKLAPTVRLFHQELLRMFLRAGQAPHVSQLVVPADRLGLEIVEAMSILAQADLVHLDPETRAVAVAYPLSGWPSPHRVVLSGGTTLAAMCAVDAIGIPLMTGESATISSSDPLTGQEIRVRHDAGLWMWEPSSAVVVLASDGCEGPIFAACTHTAFHATADLASAYLSDRPSYTGRVLSQREATTVAEREFGSLLRA